MKSSFSVKHPIPWRDQSPNNKVVKLCFLAAVAVLCAVTLSAQTRHRFSWLDACFKNPGAPYCPGHDFAVRRTPPERPLSPSVLTNPFPGANTNPTPVNPSAIDWRFADPQADALAAFDFAKASASPVARSLISQLAASRGITEAGMKTLFAGLSSVDQVAVSIRDNQVLFMLAGSVTDNIPGLDPSWKSVRVAKNAILVGPTAAVDQALQRIAAKAPLADLPAMAEQWTGVDLWAGGSAKAIGAQAVDAGMKRFSFTISFQDRLENDAVFEFSGAPDVNAVRPWSTPSTEFKVDSNVVLTRASLDPAEILNTPVGQRLSELVAAARYLPAHAMIQGLDNRSAPASPAKAKIYGLEN